MNLTQVQKKLIEKLGNEIARMKGCTITQYENGIVVMIFKTQLPLEFVTKVKSLFVDCDFYSLYNTFAIHLDKQGNRDSITKLHIAHPVNTEVML